MRIEPVLSNRAEQTSFFLYPYFFLSPSPLFLRLHTSLFSPSFFFLLLSHLPPPRRGDSGCRSLPSLLSMVMATAAPILDVAAVAAAAPCVTSSSVWQRLLPLPSLTWRRRLLLTSPVWWQ